MFTRNYWMMAAAEFANKLSEVRGESTRKSKLITVSGDVGTNAYSSNNYATVYSLLGTNIHTVMQKVSSDLDVSQNITSASISSMMGNSHSVIFGSGNTAETIDDFKLSGSAIQNIAYSYIDNSTYEEDGSTGVISYVYTITNNNDSEITIGEVGLFVETTWQTAYSGDSKYTHHFYMFERTALETPITIPAGGVGQVNYTIKMNYPTV